MKITIQLLQRDKSKGKISIDKPQWAIILLILRACSQSKVLMEEAKDKDTLLERLKKKWKLKSLFQVIMILIVFSLTGMTVVFIRPLVFSWFGYDDQTSFWIKTITYVLLIFPMYQILILVYGGLLGQFSFFWEKEKNLFNAIFRPFRNRRKKDHK